MIVLLTLGSATTFLRTNAESSDLPDSQWRLIVTGLVDNPLNLTLSNLKTMPMTTENATLYCIDYPGVPLMQGTWVGVKLSYLLEQAGVQSKAFKIAFQAADNYSTDLILQQGLQENVILAYENNGAPLAETLRLVVPGTWGYKWISQVTRINLVDYDFLGVMETRGYSDLGSGDSNENWASRLPTKILSAPNQPATTPPFPSVVTPIPSSSPTTKPSQSPLPSAYPTAEPTLASQIPQPSLSQVQTSTTISNNKGSNGVTLSLPILLFVVVTIIIAGSTMIVIVSKKKRRQSWNVQTS